MKLRLDRELNVIRSTGDPPVGILVTAYPDGEATFAIESSWEPRSRPTKAAVGSARVEVSATSAGISETATPIETRELVGAIPDDELGAHLWATASSSYLVALPIFLRQAEFDSAKSGLALLEDLYAELLRRREILEDWGGDS